MPKQRVKVRHTYLLCVCAMSEKKLFPCLLLESLAPARGDLFKLSLYILGVTLKRWVHKHNLPTFKSRTTRETKLHMRLTVALMTRENKNKQFCDIRFVASYINFISDLHPE